MIANNLHDLNVLFRKAFCLIDIGKLKYSKELGFCHNYWRINAVRDFQWPFVRIELLPTLYQPIYLVIETGMVRAVVSHNWVAIVLPWPTLYANLDRFTQ